VSLCQGITFCGFDFALGEPARSHTHVVMRMEFAWAQGEVTFDTTVTEGAP